MLIFIHTSIFIHLYLYFCIGYITSYGVVEGLCVNTHQSAPRRPRSEASDLEYIIQSEGRRDAYSDESGW